MLKRIQSQYGDWSGMAMTFNIINYVLDNVDFFKGVIRNEAVVEREERDKVRMLAANSSRILPVLFVWDISVDSII